MLNLLLLLLLFLLIQTVVRARSVFRSESRYIQKTQIKSEKILNLHTVYPQYVFMKIYQQLVEYSSLEIYAQTKKLSKIYDLLDRRDLFFSSYWLRFNYYFSSHCALVLLMFLNLIFFCDIFMEMHMIQCPSLHLTSICFISVHLCSHWHLLFLSMNAYGFEYCISLFLCVMSLSYRCALLKSVSWYRIFESSNMFFDYL